MSEGLTHHSYTVLPAIISVSTLPHLCERALRVANDNREIWQHEVKGKDKTTAMRVHFSQAHHLKLVPLIIAHTNHSMLEQWTQLDSDSHDGFPHFLDFSKREYTSVERQCKVCSSSFPRFQTPYTDRGMGMRVVVQDCVRSCITSEQSLGYDVQTFSSGLSSRPPNHYSRVFRAGALWCAHNGLSLTHLDVFCFQYYSMCTLPNPP